MVLKDQSKLTVGGERRDLTILFSDLRGFTTISEGMDPKTLSQFLNEYLTAMTDCVFEKQGTLDKYIGDAVMAFWGAPIPQEDHILRACTTACLMQKKLEQIAPDFKKRYNIDVGMGVGVNSGTVSVGNMGSQKIFEYTVLGDHVNLASRLEGLTRLYGVGVLSTKSTMDLLYAKFPNRIFYRVLDAVKVKGKKVATDLVEISLEPFDPQADDLFQNARKTFVTRDWDLAKKQFEESSKLFEQKRGYPDPVSAMFMTRCEYFKDHPPVADWDGSIEMKEK
jgi:adenylate cyclase